MCILGRTVSETSRACLGTNCCFSGKEKTHKHKQSCEIVPRFWWVAKCFVHVLVGGRSIWGRNTHKQNPPPPQKKKTERSRETFVYVLFSSFAFLAPKFLIQITEEPEVSLGWKGLRRLRACICALQQPRVGIFQQWPQRPRNHILHEHFQRGL